MPRRTPGAAWRMPLRPIRCRAGLPLRRHLLKPDGVLTLIWRADGLAAVLEALTPAFGSIAVLPIYPRPDAAAIRVLVRARKGGTRAARAAVRDSTLNDSQGSRPRPPRRCCAWVVRWILPKSERCF